MARNIAGNASRRAALAAVLVASSLAAVVITGLAQTGGISPHLDPEHGVMRVTAPWAPRGNCGHCHSLHALETGVSPYPAALFAENSNTLCYTADGASPCHQNLPANYPADEASRIPEGFPDAGYFEYNSGGAKIYGVQYRNRWPGAQVYDNPGVATGMHYFSPHRNDTDMPRLDPEGRGSCLNCHNAHGSENPFDMLVSEYRGIGGFDEPMAPSRYQLCFDCHSTFGPPGMESESRSIADYYDSAMNADGTAGHQIQMNPDVAISWPSHVRVGDKLPCYDCHNPHGSRGYNGEGPNAFLLSDERPGWSNLIDPRNNPDDNRRFCLGCHIPSDGAPGSQTVEGIVMNAIPDEDGHRSTDMRGCSHCHGRDYTTSNSFNVHHPAAEPVSEDPGPFPQE